jgi:hypothetical protein
LLTDEGAKQLWLSEDGSLLLCGPDDDPYARAWDVETRREVDLKQIRPEKTKVITISRDGRQWLTERLFADANTQRYRYTTWKRNGVKWQRNQTFSIGKDGASVGDAGFVGDALVLLVQGSLETRRFGRVTRRVKLRNATTSGYGKLSLYGTHALAAALSKEGRLGLGVFDTQDGRKISYLVGSEDHLWGEMRISTRGGVAGFTEWSSPFSAEAMANDDSLWQGPTNHVWNTETGRSLESFHEPCLEFWPHSNSFIKIWPWRLVDLLTKHQTPLPLTLPPMKGHPHRNVALSVSGDKRKLAWRNDRAEIRVETLR